MTDTLPPAPHEATARPAPLDPRLLEILVCPITKGELVYDRDAGELISRQAGLAFPIRDGIPIMLPDEARQITE
ncbi:Trm112 family protein [Lichenicola sp.]|uniref:Trm112 family protein n=1 Tax=Lichenicola sp. TaxID=2804529 RepID=UPI003B0054A2